MRVTGCIACGSIVQLQCLKSFAYAALKVLSAAHGEAATLLLPRTAACVRTLSARLLEQPTRQYTPCEVTVRSIAAMIKEHCAQSIAHRALRMRSRLVQLVFVSRGARKP